MLNFTQLLKGFVRELTTELTMRRHVWKLIPGHKEKFLKPEQTKRYNTMLLMRKVFLEMTPRELQKIVERIQRKNEEAKQEQKSLFDNSQNKAS